MIIVVTHKKSPFLMDCIASLQGVDYPVHLCINPETQCPYDPGAFYYAKKHGIETFVVLHDSMIVKDQSIFKKVFDLDGNVSIGDSFLMCLGKFEMSKLPPLPPMPINKREAIHFESTYMRSLKPNHTVCPEFKDTDKFVFLHGKPRMVLENDYLIKYKGTWSLGMI